MRNKAKVLIIGAGAVGRGLLAPKLIDAGFMVTFTDIDKDIIGRLDTMKYYPLIGRDKFKWIGPVDAYPVHRFYQKIYDFDYIFISVKSTNLPTVAKIVYEIIMRRRMRSKCTKKPIIYVIENYNNAASKFSDMLNMKHAVVLDGIANVIVPTSPHEQQDPTFTVYDPNMELVLKKVANEDAPIINTARYVSDDEFRLEWLLKLYLHCSVHAFVAYLGIENKIEYIHEVMQDKKLGQMVDWFMLLVADALDNYFHGAFTNEIRDRAQFENKAMRDELLMDDVYRVGRDPIRKLEPDDRLIGLLQFLRENVDDAFLDESYLKLLHVTNIAIEMAGLTPEELLTTETYMNLDKETFNSYEYGVIKDLENERIKR